MSWNAGVSGSSVGSRACSVFPRQWNRQVGESFPGADLILNQGRPSKHQKCPAEEWALLSPDRRSLRKGCCGGDPCPDHATPLLCPLPSLSSPGLLCLTHTLPASLGSFSAALPALEAFAHDVSLAWNILSLPSFTSSQREP